MPWTAEDFHKFSKGLSDAQARKAARMANRILSLCLRRGGSQEDCERMAIATALDRVKGESAMEHSGAVIEAKYTLKPWDGSFSRFTLEQLLRSVPRAIAAWARERARQGGREVVKDDLRLPYKEPDGTINIRAVRNALARLSQVKGLPADVLADARKELENVLEEYNKSKGESWHWVQGLVQSEPVRVGENGVAILPMVLARAGLWDFTDDYGKPYVALESPDEVFSESFINQWKGLPIILDHEPGEWIDESNVTQRIVGVVLGARQDGQYVVGEGAVWHPDALRALREGMVELSKGYACDVIDESGTWVENGEAREYNKIHTNMRLNHVAIVQRGKCGGPCRVVLQSVQSKKDGCAHTELCTKEQETVMTGEESMEFRFTVGGKEFVIKDAEGAKLFQDALNKHFEEHKAETKASEELPKAQERIAALEAEAKVYRTKCEEFEKRVRALESGEALQAMVSERLALVRKAEERIPGFVADGRSNREIMTSVIRTFDSEFKDEGRSDAEIKAVYEALLRAESAIATQAARAIGQGAVAPKSDLAQRLAEARERSRGRSARLEQKK